jgi:hypothetical protein
VVVRGKAELEEGRFRLVAEDISPLAGAAERQASRLILEVSAEGFPEERAREVHRLLQENPGDCTVLIQVVQPGGYRLTVRPQIPLRIGPNPRLTQALERVLGKGAVSYR